MSDPIPTTELPRAEEGRAPRGGVRRLLAGSPRAVLGRLTDGDPLGVRAVVGARLRARWLLLDGDRVHLRALALVAREAGEWCGRPALAVWLAEKVDVAIDEVRREGAEATGACEILARPLGLEPGAARAALDAFDRRGEPERRAFVRLVLDGEDLDPVARDEGVSASEVGRRARAVLESLLTAVRRAPASASDARRREP